MSVLMRSISGIRGIVGDSLTPPMILDYLNAFLQVTGASRVVIGRDTRTSGAMLEQIVAQGCAASNVEALTLGISSTPTVEMMVPDTFEHSDTLIIKVSVKIDEGWHINSTKPESEYLIPTQLELKGNGIEFGSAVFPTPHKKFIKIMNQELSLFAGNFQITAPLWKSSDAADLKSIEAVFSFQACNDKLCIRPSSVTAALNPGKDDGAVPETKKDSRPPAGSKDNGWQNLIKNFTTSGTAGGFIKPEPFIKFLKDPGESSNGQSSLAGKSIWAVIFIILLGGFALNLTPCVFPMIPVTIAVIGAGAQASSRTRGFIIGGFYGLGMAITYGSLGLIVTLTGTQFGVINSSPIFNFSITAVFIVLALGMFDIIHIDFTRFGSNIKYDKSQKGKIIAVFFMGCLAAILAGACVAPVVISVILYAASLYNSGQPLGLILPFLLGAGMALPWPLTGAGLSFLPKPGKWMIWVRNIFGVIILFIALYYGYLGVQGITSTPGVPKETSEISSGNSQLSWTPSLTEGLKQGLEENRPVFIDFWATWCKNCLVMDATTLKDSSVVSYLKEFVLVKFQAENPDEDNIKKLLKKFGIIGLPAYVILKPGE